MQLWLWLHTADADCLRFVLKCSCVLLPSSYQVVRLRGCNTLEVESAVSAVSTAALQEDTTLPRAPTTSATGVGIGSPGAAPAARRVQMAVGAVDVADVGAHSKEGADKGDRDSSSQPRGGSPTHTARDQPRDPSGGAMYRT